MDAVVGEVIEGKVSGITKFGFFVALPDGKNGLVHISEISDSYVSDINALVQPGQTVRVRIMAVDEAGKIRLSMKRAEEKTQPQRRPGKSTAPKREPQAACSQQTARTEQPQNMSADLGFEDKLKKFMKEADSRIADNRLYNDRRQRSRRR